MLDDEKDPFDLDQYLTREYRRNQVGRVLLQEGYIFPSTSCMHSLRVVILCTFVFSALVADSVATPYCSTQHGCSRSTSSFHSSQFG